MIKINKLNIIDIAMRYKEIQIYCICIYYFFEIWFYIYFFYTVPFISFLERLMTVQPYHRTHELAVLQDTYIREHLWLLLEQIKQRIYLSNTITWLYWEFEFCLFYRSWSHDWLLCNGHAGKPESDPHLISAHSQWLQALISVFWWGQGSPSVRIQ